MNKNVIIAAPSHNLDGYCFTSEAGEENKSLTFNTSLTIGDRSISSFQMAFYAHKKHSDWLIWIPLDNQIDHQNHDVVRTFFLGGTADGVHGSIRAKDIQDNVISPKGQPYKIYWRYRHWVFYIADEANTTH